MKKTIFCLIVKFVATEQCLKQLLWMAGIIEVIAPGLGPIAVKDRSKPHWVLTKNIEETKGAIVQRLSDAGNDLGGRRGLCGDACQGCLPFNWAEPVAAKSLRVVVSKISALIHAIEDVAEAMKLGKKFRMRASGSHC